MAALQAPNDKHQVSKSSKFQMPNLKQGPSSKKQIPNGEAPAGRL
jgi:hypothetical protein